MVCVLLLWLGSGHFLGHCVVKGLLLFLILRWRSGDTMVVFASICWSFFSSKGVGDEGRSRKREGGEREAVVEMSRFGVTLSFPLLGGFP